MRPPLLALPRPLVTRALSRSGLCLLTTTVACPVLMLRLAWLLLLVLLLVVVPPAVSWVMLMPALGRRGGARVVVRFGRGTDTRGGLRLPNGEGRRVSRASDQLMPTRGTMVEGSVDDEAADIPRSVCSARRDAWPSSRTCRPCSCSLPPPLPPLPREDRHAHARGISPLGLLPKAWTGSRGGGTPKARSPRG